MNGAKREYLYDKQRSHQACYGRPLQVCYGRLLQVSWLSSEYWSEQNHARIQAWLRTEKQQCMIVKWVHSSFFTQCCLCIHPSHFCAPFTQVKLLEEFPQDRDFESVISLSTHYSAWKALQFIYSTIEVASSLFPSLEWGLAPMCVAKSRLSRIFCANSPPQTNVTHGQSSIPIPKSSKFLPKVFFYPLATCKLKTFDQNCRYVSAKWNDWQKEFILRDRLTPDTTCTPTNPSLPPSLSALSTPATHQRI